MSQQHVARRVAATCRLSYAVKCCTTNFLFINIIVSSSFGRGLLVVYSDCILKGLESVRS